MKAPPKTSRGSIHVFSLPLWEGKDWEGKIVGVWAIDSTKLVQITANHGGSGDLPAFQLSAAARALDGNGHEGTAENFQRVNSLLPLPLLDGRT